MAVNENEIVAGVQFVSKNRIVEVFTQNGLFGVFFLDDADREKVQSELPKNCQK